jgi:hypothetical protein
MGRRMRKENEVEPRREPDINTSKFLIGMLMVCSGIIGSIFAFPLFIWRLTNSIADALLMVAFSGIFILITFFCFMRPIWITLILKLTHDLENSPRSLEAERWHFQGEKSETSTVS